MRKIIIMAALAATFISSAQADEMSNYVPDAKLVGKGEYHKLVWDVYTAKLYAPGGVYEKGQPLALSLSYHMEIDGSDIAEKSIEEMQKQAPLDPKQQLEWQALMEKIFPDVNDTTVLTGILTKDGKTIFLHNGKFAGKIDDKEFGRRFFDIWLGAKTSDNKLTQQLLGNEK